MAKIIRLQDYTETRLFVLPLFHSKYRYIGNTKINRGAVIYNTIDSRGTLIRLTLLSL